MKRLLAGIVAMLRNSVAFVWDKCVKTGAWTLRAVTSTFPGGTPEPIVCPANDNVEIEPVLPADDGDMSPIRELAAAIVNGRATAEMCARVDERTFNWLSNLDRSMVAKVLLASDGQIRGHLRGKSTIRGVLLADEASVEAYRDAWSRTIGLTIADTLDEERELASHRI